MTDKAKPAEKPLPVAAARRTAKPAAAKTPAGATLKDPAQPPAAKPKAGKADKPMKAEKPKKIKMVRDSFTMPENDYAKLAELKKKCLQAGVHVKKGELLRAGLLSLSKLPAAALIKAVEQVEKLKTGRPAKP
ncbi:MAG: hypothetical protein ACYC05_07175 [Sulfuricella sp.]|nr:hypothetical protein [Gammaproteobacteria bacterium]